ncbi:MAG: hypothetical protein ACRC9L_00355 [Brevinema sp.]
MIFVFLLLVAVPSFGRVYIDYTDNLPAQRVLSNVGILTIPGRISQAEALGYSAKEIAIYLPISALSLERPASISEQIVTLGRRGRYTVFIDLKNLPNFTKERIKQQLQSIKNIEFLEEAPITLPSSPIQQDQTLFRIVLSIIAGRDVFLAENFSTNPYSAMILNYTLRPKQRLQVLTWEQGQMVLYPDALLVQNEGELAITTLKRDFFRRGRSFTTKSEQGSMILWENDARLQMILFPQQVAFWRML